MATKLPTVIRVVKVIVSIIEIILQHKKNKGK
jgi:hypothetical protein